MILAAGLGTRLRPLTEWCAKPALPVRGIPVIAHTLTWLARHDVTEVVVNLHHLPETVRDAVERHRPASVRVRYSEERVLLGTGGGIRAVADFLQGSEASVVVAGDMLVDFDLSSAIARHRERGDRYTLLLRTGDPHSAEFGTLGVDDAGCVRRIGRRFDLGRETGSGLFMGVRIVAARCLRDFPDADTFEDLTDWLAPQLRAGARDIRTESIPLEQSLWVPVGTTEEYLSANLDAPLPRYRDEIPGRPHAEVVEDGRGKVVVGEGAIIDPAACLERVVVWPHETVPGDVHAQNGVWANGHFIASGETASKGRKHQP